MKKILILFSIITSLCFANLRGDEWNYIYLHNDWGEVISKSIVYSNDINNTFNKIYRVWEFPTITKKADSYYLHIIGYNLYGSNKDENGRFTYIKLDEGNKEKIYLSDYEQVMSNYNEYTNEYTGLTFVYYTIKLSSEFLERMKKSNQIKVQIGEDENMEVKTISMKSFNSVFGIFLIEKNFFRVEIDELNNKVKIFNEKVDYVYKNKEKFTRDEAEDLEREAIAFNFNVDQEWYLKGIVNYKNRITSYENKNFFKKLKKYKKGKSIYEGEYYVEE